MTTMTLKLPEILATRIAQEAKRRRHSKSAVVRQCIEHAFAAPAPTTPRSFHDLASKICGAGSKGIKDLSTNPTHMDGFGR